MKESSKSKRIIFIAILILATVIFFGWAISTSIHSRHQKDNTPIMTDSPIYVPLESGDELSLDAVMNQDIEVQAVSVVMVNLDANGTGRIHVIITDNSGNEISDGYVDESYIKVGEWTKLNVSFEAKKDEHIVIRIIPENCNPYLMYVPESGMKLMPFAETVSINGEDIQKNVSIGITSHSDAISVSPIIVFCAIIMGLIVFSLSRIIWLGKEKSKELMDDSKARKYLTSHWNGYFLLLIFIYLAVGVFSVAYKNGIYITADSAGYLREAVNMYAGNGYSYDGLAGYKSWFANWPILYPAMICASMIVTKTESYAASKIVTLVLVLLIIGVLKLKYKNKAWIYSLALLNLGFISLTYYTWSEMPFMLFILLFGLKLGDIVCETAEVRTRDYILLAVYGILAFLTRYFGIFVWAVAGLYILLFLWRYIRTKEKCYAGKAVRLTITAAISGMVSFGYLLMNKIQNGMPSGVSRSDWWDDYVQLTKDLIDSLVTEVFNAFHINISRYVLSVNYPIKVIFVLVIVALIVWVVVKNLSIYERETVMILMAGIYYCMFIVIRYFSSMDTFYFRFFEPASFLASLGLIGLCIKKYEATDRSIATRKLVRIAFTLITFFTALGIIQVASNGLMLKPYDYYSVAQAEWDKAYAEIPERSVVIFSDLDFRSQYYRPDVVEGEMYPSDSMEDIRSRFYGSKNLVIQKEYAEVMIDSGEYDSEVSDFLASGLDTGAEAAKYISIPLNQ